MKIVESDHRRRHSRVEFPRTASNPLRSSKFNNLSEGPLAQQRLDEALGLAGGVWRIGLGANVLDLQPPQQLGKAPGLVSCAVVGHHPADPHAQAAVVAQRRQQVRAGTPGRLIGQHQTEAHTRMVINGHMQCLPARL